MIIFVLLIYECIIKLNFSTDTVLIKELNQTRLKINVYLIRGYFSPKVDGVSIMRASI